MPKAPIHEDTSFVFPEYQIWMTRKSLMIQPVTKSSFPQPTPHNYFWLRVFTTNRRHCLMTLLWGEMIHTQLFLFKKVSNLSPFHNIHYSCIRKRMPYFQLNWLIVLEEFLHELYLEHQPEIIGVVVWLTLFASTHTGNLYQV